MRTARVRQAAPGEPSRSAYPYTTIVGVPELDYGVRPLYKRKPRKTPTADWRPIRAAACDELISRVTGLSAFDPPIDLLSHEVTRKLVEEPSPLADRPYKSREDLLDAAIMRPIRTDCGPRSSRLGGTSRRQVDWVTNRFS